MADFTTFDEDAVPPAPNALPAASASFGSLVSSAAHPQLLILYSYFGLIGWLLQRIFLRSILTGTRWADARLAPKSHVALWSALSAISLSSTWYFMFRYFAHSYNQWEANANFTSYGLPTLPVCGSLASTFTSHAERACHVSLAASFLQRTALWLRDTSLFREAWLLVVRDDANWWWSVEVCLFTVGAWVVFLQTQRRRMGVPQVWAYMLLGQTVAISFAAALFHLALSLRPLPTGSLAQSAALTAASGEGEPGLVTKFEEEIIDAKVTKRGGASSSSPSDRQIVKQRTTTRYALQPPSTHPSLASRLLLWTIVSLTALGVGKRPSTLGGILVMHLAPVLLTLPHRHLHRFEEYLEERWLRPAPGSDDEAATHASNERLKRLLRPSRLLASLAAYGLALKVTTTWKLLTLVQTSVPVYERVHSGTASILLKILYPITFHSHPAQSSISSDAVCLALITMAFIATDAVTLPRSLGGRWHLRRATRESRAQHWDVPAVALFLITPILGPSTAFAAWAALREHSIEEAEAVDEARLRKHAGEGVGLVVSEQEEVVVYSGDVAAL